MAVPTRSFIFTLALGCILQPALADDENYTDHQFEDGADFKGRSLKRAKFEFAHLKNVNFGRSEDGTRTDLSGAKFDYAILEGVDFSDAIMDDKTSFEGADIVNCIWGDRKGVQDRKAGEPAPAGAPGTGLDFAAEALAAGSRSIERGREHAATLSAHDLELLKGLGLDI